MILLGFSLFVIGFMMGGWALSIWKQAFAEIEKSKDKDTILEQTIEIKRLREQVSRLIGVE